MKVAPRAKKSNIMTKHWWFYGNLPHCFFEAACVLASLMTGLYLFTGKILAEDINNLCTKVGSKYPVGCVCNRLNFGDNKFETHINWYELPTDKQNWGKLNDETQALATNVDPPVMIMSKSGGQTMQQGFDYWIADAVGAAAAGKYRKAKDPANPKNCTDAAPCSDADFALPPTSWGEYMEQMEAFAKVDTSNQVELLAKGFNGKQWVGGAAVVSTSVGGKQFLHGEGEDQTLENHLHEWQEEEEFAGELCAAKGSRLGRTQAFITAVYCEMMRAYTVRCAPGDGTNPPWMWEVFMRNWWIHFACTISFWLTILVTVIPGLNNTLFLLRAPPFPAYLIAIAFPILNAILDEFVPKPIYKLFVIYPRMKADKEAAERARDAALGSSTMGMSEPQPADGSPRRRTTSGSMKVQNKV